MHREGGYEKQERQQPAAPANAQDLVPAEEPAVILWDWELIFGQFCAPNRSLSEMSRGGKIGSLFGATDLVTHAALLRRLLCLFQAYCVPKSSVPLGVNFIAGLRPVLLLESDADTSAQVRCHQSNKIFSEALLDDMAQVLSSTYSLDGLRYPTWRRQLFAVTTPSDYRHLSTACHCSSSALSVSQRHVTFQATGQSNLPQITG